VGVTAERVLRQSGTANVTTTCATQKHGRPIRGSERDPCPSKALVNDGPGHEGPLPDVLPDPHLWSA